MSYNIYETIKNEYEKKRKAAYEKLEARRDEVYSRIPEIREIDAAIRLAGIRCNKTVLSGVGSADMAAAGLSDEINDMRSEKERLLSANGYAADYLEMDYQCRQCGDTGFIETENGSLKCSCFKQHLLNTLFRQSNLNLDITENFSAFDENYYSDAIDEEKYGISVSPRSHIRYVRERCMKFVENFSSPGERNLFFTGPTGVGKTFMANCIALELMKKGITVLYQTAPVLFDTIYEFKLKAFREEGYEGTGYRKIMEVELLIIDDLGTESPSAARYAELLNILNTRQTHNLTRPCKTIISTNIGIKKLQEYYDERVVSRIIGCFDMFRFSGDDIRRIKKMNIKA